MNSFISHSRPWLLALVAVLGAELLFDWLARPDRIERTNFLQFSFLTPETPQRLFVYHKLDTFGESQPTIVQAGFCAYLWRRRHRAWRQRFGSRRTCAGNASSQSPRTPCKSRFAQTISRHTKRPDIAARRSECSRRLPRASKRARCADCFLGTSRRVRAQAVRHRSLARSEDAQNRSLSARGAHGTIRTPVMCLCRSGREAPSSATPQIGVAAARR